MTASTGFSIVRRVGRYSAPERGMQFGQSHSPRPLAAALPPGDLASLRAGLTPVMAALDRDRAAHLLRADRLLGMAVPGAAVLGLVLGWGLAGDALAGLFLAALGAAFTLIVLLGKMKDGPRAATRSQIIDAIARHLMGFRVDPDPAFARDGLAELKLFSQLRRITVDLCLTGQRDGRAVAISRIGLMFGAARNDKEKQGDGLCFVMVEVALPETAQATATTTIMSKDASAIARAAQYLRHMEKAVPTGDAAFDARYTVFGCASRLTPALRGGFDRLEAEARCAAHGLTEAPAGTGLRPWVVILPGKLVVLTPLSMFDGAFEPPPLWERLDPDRLIPAFASDLAILNGYLNAALSLPIGEIT